MMKTRHHKQNEVACDWDRIRSLYNKLLYSLYSQKDVGKARQYARQLEGLLAVADPDQETIFGEECWSLIHEANGNLEEAIKHRRKEIELIRRLHAISRNQPYEAAATKVYGASDLSDRLNLLAILYHDRGDLHKAIKTLKESKRLCTDQGIVFGAEDLLHEYQEEQP